MKGRGLAFSEDDLNRAQEYSRRFGLGGQTLEVYPSNSPSIRTPVQIVLAEFLAHIQRKRGEELLLQPVGKEQELDWALESYRKAFKELELPTKPSTLTSRKVVYMHPRHLLRFYVYKFSKHLSYEDIAKVEYLLGRKAPPDHSTVISSCNVAVSLKEDVPALARKIRLIVGGTFYEKECKNDSHG